MYTRPTFSLKLFARNGARPLFLMIIYSGSIHYAYEHLDMEYIDLPLSISTVLGFAVSLLVGFRTNSAYDRWWEGRKIWGAIVNDSRSLMRQFLGFANVNEEENKSMANFIIAWTYALKAVLRDQDPIKTIEPNLTEDQISELSEHDNVPNGILTLMGKKLRQLRSEEAIDAFQYMSLNETINRMCDSMGKCERIKKTVFPIEYRVFTKTAIFIFMLMLPFGMLESTGMFVVLISTVVLFFFLFMERIAHYMQNPFRNKPSDTPMSALCRTIEINLLQMIGADKIPEPIQVDKKGNFDVNKQVPSKRSSNCKDEISTGSANPRRISAVVMIENILQSDVGTQPSIDLILASQIDGVPGQAAIRGINMRFAPFGRRKVFK